jgi:hypothetical protein
MMNMRYYYDLFYRQYTLSIYSSKGKGMAFRDIWGTASFIRVIVHMAAWSTGGLFWIWTFLPYAAPWIIFSYVTLGLAIVQLMRIILVLVMYCFSLILDNFDEKGLLHDHFGDIGSFGHEFVKKGNEHFSLPDMDYNMEMMNISVQFVIFPLFNYGINNYWRQQAELESEEGYVNDDGMNLHPGTGKSLDYPRTGENAEVETKTNGTPGFLPIPHNNSPNDFSLGWE